MKTTLSLVIVCLTIIGCGRKEKPLSGISEDRVVVRSKATIDISVGAAVGKPHFAVGQNIPITVTNAPATSMTVDTSQFVPPSITNAVVDFGNLSVSGLSDNDLKVCGASGNQKCGTAILRLYTTGVAGAGLYNSADAYGAPLTGSLTTPLTIGLGSANAAVMQTVSVAPSKHVVRLTDFASTPTYNIKADFTDAGAGTFTTTLVLEYALAP